MIRKRRWWWLLAALIPLLYLPLRAQETPKAAPATPATPAGQTAVEPAAAPALPEEQVSADNNLTFPVDI